MSVPSGASPGVPALRIDAPEQPADSSPLLTSPEISPPSSHGVPAPKLETSPLKKNVLVVGGAGFLGSHLVELLLDRGANVRIFDSKSPEVAFIRPVEFVKGNILNTEDLMGSMKGIDIVFHTASLTDPQRHPKELELVNVQGTKNIIQACLAHKVSQLIYTSSSAVVIGAKDLVNANESLPYAEKFLDSYCQTKAQAEKLVLSCNRMLNSKGKPLLTIALRPHAIFGPRDHHFISQLISRARKGELTHMIGDGTNLCDFTYVENAVYAHYLAALRLSSDSRVSGEAFFITNAEPIAFWEFIGKFLAEMGCVGPARHIPFKLAYILAWILEYLHWVISFVLPFIPRPSLTKHMVCTMGKSYTFSNEKAANLLGYAPVIPLETAIEITIEYFSRGLAAALEDENV